jgi:hypothetical protein
MTVAQLICELALVLFKLLSNLVVLVMSLFESSLVKFFLFVYEKELVFFSGQKLGQLGDSVFSLTNSNDLFLFIHFLCNL